MSSQDLAHEQDKSKLGLKRLGTAFPSNYKRLPEIATNRWGSLMDPLFKKACSLAQVQPTKRQYSKWCNRTGRAYDQRNAAKAELFAKVVQEAHSA